MAAAREGSPAGELELFHRLAELESARVRQLVMEEGLKAQVNFRNVIFPEAARALAHHGGQQTPALWDGERLYQGSEAVTARLLRLRPPR